MKRYVVLLFAAALCGWPQSAPEARQARIAGRIEAALRDFQGSVCLYARNLDTGASFGRRENERVRTASTIKLPIMAAVFAAVAEGKVRWNEELTLREAGKVSGSGVMTELSDGVRLPLADVMHLMIVVSDNTATNLILDRITADYVNARMDELGLGRTRCLRKVRGDGADLKAPWGHSAAGRLPENQRFGLGVSTSREMVELIEKIERGEVVSPEASREMIRVLKRQQFKDGIGRQIRFPVASKSGALDALRSDVGIVWAPGGRIAIAVTCDDMPKVDYSPENAGNKMISALTAILVEELSH